MVAYKYFESSNESLRIRAAWPLLFALLLVPLVFLIATNEPLYIESSLADASLSLSNSASVFGITVLTLILTALLASRPRMSVRYRLQEAIVLVGAVIVFAGGGAFVNENIIKTKIKAPRPNIEYLQSSFTDNALGMSVEEYYARGNGTPRSQALLRAIVTSDLKISEDVKKHWLSETGYSFPSGHSFAAFFMATFFLLFVCSFVDVKRTYVVYLLLPWAVLVCYSRVILHIHKPIDVAIGALQGCLLGWLAWLLVRLIVRKLVQIEIKG